MLKKAAMKYHDNRIQEYMNPLVIFAYVLIVGTTLYPNDCNNLSNENGFAGYKLYWRIEE